MIRMFKERKIKTKIEPYRNQTFIAHLVEFGDICPDLIFQRKTRQQLRIQTRCFHICFYVHRSMKNSVLPLLSFRVVMCSGDKSSSKERRKFRTSQAQDTTFKSLLKSRTCAGHFRFSTITVFSGYFYLFLFIKVDE